MTLLNAKAEAERHDPLALSQAIERAGGAVVGSKVKCPFHDDKRPSASIFQGDDGAWRFRCFTCDWSGDVHDVRAKATGRPVGELLKPTSSTTTPAAPKPKTPKRYADLGELVRSFGARHVARYVYTCPTTGKADLVVVRTSDKQFFQYRQTTPGGEILSGAPEGLRPIYNRSRVADAETVVVCEGEKDVHTLHRFGIVGTTSPGGAGNAAHADWSPVAGKQLILWPDNDEPGKRHMADAERITGALSPPARCRIIDPAKIPLIPEKGDASDLVERLTAEALSEDEIREAILDVLGMAAAAGPAAELRKQIIDIGAGRRRAVVMPGLCLTSKLTQALLPGAITIVCGSPGSAKSLLVQEQLMMLGERNERVAIFHLEESTTFHLRRAAAQLAGASWLTDEAAVALSDKRALAMIDQHTDFLETFGRTITTAQAQGATHAEICAWASKHAGAGARVLMIDPITLSIPPDGARPWEADRALVAKLKEIAGTHGCSIILVSHPAKNPRPGSAALMDGLAGGAALSRASQTILWLQRLEEPIEGARIAQPELVFVSDQIVTHLLHIAKARSGSGTGTRVALSFDAQTLRTKELGILIEKGK